MMAASATVYRAYSANGDVLYVGCTMNGASRLDSHRPKDWWTEVARIELTHCASIAAARELESLQIAEMRPRYNRHGRVPTVADLDRMRQADDEWYASLALCWLAHARGLNRRTLAERAGLSVKTIYAIGRGASRNPTDETLLALASALQMNGLALVQALRGEISVQDTEPVAA